MAKARKSGNKRVKSRASGNESGYSSGDSDDKKNSSIPKISRVEAKTLHLDCPLHSTSDTKSYRHIKLPNGLRALLISDTTVDNNPAWMHETPEYYRLRTNGCSTLVPTGNSCIDKTYWNFPSRSNCVDSCCCEYPLHRMSQDTLTEARAAMSLVVQVGWSSDPKEVQGLAHFTEHMLHYGSKKYPGEGVYWNYIMNHGSTIGAFTQVHSTVYHFGMNPKFLGKAMDLFGGMVTYPEFPETTTRAEVQAINSEFLLYKNSDFGKIADILTVAIRENNPLKKFSCGDEITLNRKDLHSRLVKFHRDNYVGNKMTFSIQSSDSLDFLQDLVEKHLGHIPLGEEPQKNVPNELRDPYDPTKFNKLYTLQGSPQIHLIWNFPPEEWMDFKRKPLIYLQAALSDGREGSLQHYFLQRLWIHDLKCGSNCEEYFQNHYTSLFIFSLDLTEKGTQNINEIVQSIFAYIKTIRNASVENKQRLWKEIQTVYQMDYDHGGNGYPDENTLYASRKLVHSSSGKDIFTAESLLEGNFDAEYFDAFVQKIDPAKTMYIQFQEQDFTKKKDLKLTNHSNVQYTVNSIPRGFTTKPSCTVLQKFQFPPPNPYISTNSSIQEYCKDREVNTPRMYLTHSMTPGLTIPKASYTVRLFSSFVGKSVRAQHMLNMWAKKIEIAMSPCISCAMKSGIRVHVSKGQFMIQLEMKGYPEYMGSILREFCAIVNQQSLTSNEFDLVKGMEEKSFDQQLGNSYILLRLLLERTQSIDRTNIIDNPSVICSLNRENLENFISVFKSSMLVQVILKGNVSQAQSEEAQALVQREIDFRPVVNREVLGLNSMIPFLPVGEKCIRIKGPVNSDENNYILNTYKVSSEGSKAFSLCSVAVKLMDGRVFQTLRTEKQLAYSLQTFGPNSEEHICFRIFLVSPCKKHTACAVNKEIDAFLITFYEKYLSVMEEKDFEDCRIKFRTEDNISLEEVQVWYKQFVVDAFPSKLNGNQFVGLAKLSLQVMGCKSECCRDCDEKIEFIGNCESIRFAAPRGTATQLKSGLKPKQDYFVYNIPALHEEYFR